MDCPFCDWEGEPKNYLEHHKNCPGKTGEARWERFAPSELKFLEPEKKKQALEVMTTFLTMEIQKEPLKSLAKSFISSTLDTYQKRFGLTGIEAFSDDYATELQRRNIIAIADLEPFRQAVKQYLEAI